MLALPSTCHGEVFRSPADEAVLGEDFICCNFDLGMTSLRGGFDSEGVVPGVVVVGVSGGVLTTSGADLFTMKRTNSISPNVAGIPRAVGVDGTGGTGPAEENGV